MDHSFQIVTIIGELVEIGEIYDLTPGRKAQRIIVKVSYNDTRVKTDYFGIFIYGNDIEAFWSNYDQQHKPHSLQVEAKLNGRMKDNRNTLTLTYKRIRWIYD